MKKYKPHLKVSEHTPKPLSTMKQMYDRNYAFEKRARGIKDRLEKWRALQAEKNRASQ